jgi:glutamyl-tRNA synthetase/glutamyl-Q tRNA(Asp) synthetase
MYTWGLADALGGTVLLRIEDHDRERSRPEYDRGIRDDLAWLGLRPDDDGESTEGGGCIRQSEREPVYAEALALLAARGLVYACTCSRKDIEQAASDAGTESRYPGTCRARGLPSGAGSSLRLRLEPGAEYFDDVLLGAQTQDPLAQSGDLLVRDRLVQWTYQFAVTVDDTDQRIDLVIRGADLLASTGRQVRLARLLGRRDPPRFLHHPLLYGNDSAKLSKSNRDTGIRELRARGLSAADVLGLAGARAGLIERPRPLSADRLSTLMTGSALMQKNA